MFYHVSPFPLFRGTLFSIQFNEFGNGSKPQNNSSNKETSIPLVYQENKYFGLNSILHLAIMYNNLNAQLSYQTTHHPQLS